MPTEHLLRVARTARYFTLAPERWAQSPREIWFVLHGYGHLAERFLRSFADLDDGTRLIVAPEGLSRFYLVPPASAPPNERPVGASWMTREAREHEIEDYVALLDDVADDVRARLVPASSPNAGAPRIVLLGFSQGTATAARWVASGRVEPHAVILWGGVLPPEIDLSSVDHPLRRTRLAFVVGTRDEFATPKVLETETARLRAAGVEPDVRRFEGGHAMDRTQLQAVADDIAHS